MRAGTGIRNGWLVAAALVLLPVLIMGAHAAECPISVNTSSSQEFPAISGDRIVWEDLGTWDLFLYDLAGRTETRLTTDGATGEHTSPAISGPYIVSLGVNPSFNFNVSLLDLLTPEELTLSENGFSPGISGDRAVWIDSLSLGIESYHVASGLHESLLADPFDRTQPAIGGDLLAFVNGTCDAPCTAAIWVKDLATGGERLVAAADNGRGMPSVSGNRVAWSDQRDSDGDIFVYDLLTSVETRITTDGSNAGPSLDGDLVAWMHGTDIYLVNLSDGNPPVMISSGGSSYWPKISGDRVVWYKDPGTGKEDVYLYTVGSSLSCPGAGFAADTTSGLSPLTVQFADTSTGSPDHWLWEFGDGSTSTDQNPTHVYAADGSYSVALTVANPVGRDYTTLADSIRVGPVPLVSFLANQTYGIAPLPVRFTDTSSGSPTGWSWDFGDGATGVARNPVHTYGTPGNYTVSLSATNTYGTGTGGVPDFVRVLNGVNLVSVANFDGLSVTDAGGRQEITLETSKMVSDTLDPGAPASFSFVPQPPTGWQRMTFSSSDGFGFARDGGGIIRGNLSSCTLESRELVPGTFTTDAGNHLPVSYRLDLSAYPRDAIINATIWEGVMPADDSAFRSTLVATSSDFTSILGTAYTLSFVPENLSHVLGATLNLSVSTAWVQKYGNENNIAVVRLGDDGTGETLNPSATTADASGTLDLFTVPSPHGLSRFALVSAVGSSNLIQMGARVATQLIQSSGVVGGGGSGSPPSVKDRTPWEQPTSPANTPARPAVTYYGEGKIDTTPTGITRESVIIKSADWGASLAIDAGTVAFNSMHEPLTFVTAQPVTAGSIPPVADGAGTLFTGIAYDVGPDGATFNPPATLSFTVPGDRWNENTRYSIQTYSTQAGSWEDITTSVDPGSRIVSGQVSHLCIFGLFTVPAAGAPAPARGVSAPAVTSGEQPKPLPRTPMGIFTGMLGWIYDTATTHILVSLTVLFCVLASVYAYTRRAWLSRNRTWITLYLISLTGLLWASFVYSESGSLPDSVFIITTVTGLNLIVHILRFDRIDLSSRALRGYVEIGRR